MTDLTLTVERNIAASPAVVFAAWLDPALLARFMTPGPGMTVPRAETDPRVGGRFDIVMKAGDQEIPHWGVYSEITPNSRLSFTWQSPFSVDDSEVTIDFTPDGDGTHVRLAHVKFVDAASRDNHRGGWVSILDALAQAA